MAVGATLTAPNSITATTDNADYEVEYKDGKYSVVEAGKVFIGDAKYKTLAAALAAAKAGDVITLGEDITEDVEVSKDVTIDGAGKTYTGKMTLTSNKGTVTVKNVNFDGKGYNGYAVETRGVYYLTVEDCTAQNYGYGFVQLASSTVLTTVKNVTVSDMNYGVKVDYATEVVLENVDITAGVAAVLNSNYGEKTITIKNSELNIYGTWTRNNTTKTNVVFEGANTVGEFKADADIDNFKLAVGATLTASEGLDVTTVEDYTVEYNDGVYTSVPGLGGKGTEANPYLIKTVADLVKFRDSVNAGETKYNASGVYVALAADIDLASVENWEPIGSFDYSFDANFDGKGKAIKNLKISSNAAATAEAYLGFFGVTANNVIKNLVIENVTINTEAQIVAAAIAYPYYTTVENITVKGDIAIKGGNYTAGVLAYTRLCQNAKNLAVVGNGGSYITGAQVVGGVIADIQMNKGLVANYSNFSAQGVTISGTKMVGGISGIIAKQSLNGATVANVTLVSGDARVGTVAGSLGGVSTISNVVVENVNGATAVIGATYDGANAVEARIGNTYYATLEAALAAEGDEVELLAPITVAADETLVLDLQGKTVSHSKECTASYQMVNNKGNLTIKNGKLSFTDTGDGDASFGWGSYTVRNEGTLVVEDATIEHLGAQTFGTHMICAIFQYCGSTTINGGTISTPNYRSARLWKGEMTINDGNFEGQLWVQAVDNTANLVINGGEFAPRGNDGSSVFVTNNQYDVELAVTGGKFATKIGCSNANKLEGAIKGGSFTKAAIEGTNSALVAAEYAIVQNGEYWDVIPAVAEVNGKYYASFDEAYAAANGATIELLATAVLETTATYENATVKAIFGNDDVAFRIQGGATVTFNNMNVEADDYCFIVGEKEVAANLVINGGNYKGETSIASVTKGNLTVTDGTFEVEPYQGNYNYTFNCYDANYKAGEATVTISGGKFYNFNPANNAAEGAGTNFVAEGYVAGCHNDWWTVGEPVVKVGKVAYPSIQTAVDAVPEGEAATIKVAKDHNITGYTVLDGNYPMSVVVSGGKKITLDLNGKTVTYEEKLDFTLSSVFYVSGSGSEFSFVDSSEKGTGVLDVKSHRGVVNRVFWSGTYAVMKFYSGTYYLRPADENGDFGWMFYNNIGDSYFYGGTYIMSPNGYDMLGCQGSGVIPAHKHNIIAGTFNRDVAKITRNVNIAEGSVQRKNADGMYEVFEVVAKIGDAPYKSLAEAVEAAQANDVVTLVKDATGAGVVINKDVTIDFNENTYSFNEGVGSTGTPSNGFQILKGNTVTLKNGTLNVADEAANKFYILVQNYANLTVKDMDLDGTNLDKWSLTDGDSYVLSNNSGNVVIEGETNIFANNDGDKAFAFDACDKTSWGYTLPVVKVYTTGEIVGKIENSATIELYAGTYSFDVKDWCADGYATFDNHDDTWTVESLNVDEMTIDFNEYYKRDAVFEVQNEKTVGEFTYTRDLSHIGELANAWVALYLPVEIPVSVLTEQGLEVAYFNNVHSYDNDGDAIVDDMVMEYIIIKSGTLFANTPYMIRTTAEANDLIKFTLNGVTLCKTVGEGAKQTVLNMSSAYVEFSVGGVYKSIFGDELLNTVYASRLNTEVSPSIYVPYQGKWSNGDGNHANVFFSPFNVYLTLNMKEGAPFKISDQLNTIGSRVVGEENDGVTTIYDVPVDMNVEGLIFDLNGRRVNETEKGIYIINGKKVLVK